MGLRRLFKWLTLACYAALLIVGGIQASHANELDEQGFIITAPKLAPEELLCRFPMLWRTERILMPYPRTPLAVDEKAVYSGNDRVYALDRQTGSVLWAFEMPEVDYDLAFRAEGINALTVDEDTVYFGGYAKALYAIDKRTGQERWHYDADGFISETIAMDAQRVYFSARGFTYSIDKSSGQLVWKRHAQSDFPATSPVLDGPRLYVFSGKYAMALNKDTGEMIWKTVMDDGVVFNPMDLTPYLYQRQIISTTSGNEAISFDTETGKPLWVFDRKPTLPVARIGPGTGEYVLLSSKSGWMASFSIREQTVKWWFAPFVAKTFMAPVVYRNTVIQGNDMRYVYGLDLNSGQEVFRFPLDEETRGLRALVIRDDVMYATGINGKVQAYTLKCPQLESRGQ